MQNALSAPVKTEITALWQLAWPILIGQLANVGMAVADVAMAGHASAQDLAGVSLGSSIWIIVIVTLMGIMMSVNPTVAHYVGAQEFSKVPHVVRQGLTDRKFNRMRPSMAGFLGDLTPSKSAV